MTRRRTFLVRVRSSFSRAQTYARFAVFLCIAAVTAAGCSKPEAVHKDVVTVEGLVTVRGHEPFVRYVLETSDRNFYALRIPEKWQEEFQTPARLAVTGRIYVDDWDGRPIVHLDVTEFTRTD